MRLLSIFKFPFRCLRVLYRMLFAVVSDSVKHTVMFEAQSFIKRKFSKPLVLNEEEINYLNVGSGLDTFEDYINIDFFGNPFANYHADLRFALLIEDNVADGIFTEHTFEHLKYEHTELLLQECYRVLKPGSCIRIIVPDISIFVKNYANGNIEWFKEWESYMFLQSSDAERRKRRMISPMTAISFVTQEYGHVSCWDFETMEKFLQKANFKDIKQMEYGKSFDQKLLKDNDSIARKSVSLYVEARK